MRENARWTIWLKVLTKMETENDNNKANVIAPVKVPTAAWFKSIKIVTWQVCKHSKSARINNFCHKIHRLSL